MSCNLIKISVGDLQNDSVELMSSNTYPMLLPPGSTGRMNSVTSTRKNLCVHKNGQTINMDLQGSKNDYSTIIDSQTKQPIMIKLLAVA